ncbi:hypothetical protein [Cerasicoccus arenae]|uniref:Uncharacterized protein n=1 Tax=Cerasicoccus arenae TaxID=424488 RepID=A0A8J3DHM0_9BACT|nr:hypothetical protein [Cerasicoccus arenae]MBK1857228.1 hypothetical protein [Cerasicoccus arenae]GHC00131.1 hypothetical protein GCM10007047_15480 [Cerasicoccus arenae]
MRKGIYWFLTMAGAVMIAPSALHAQVAEAASVVDYNPNIRLQAFFEALPSEMQERISNYRIKATEVEAEVAEYNERPLTGLPPSSFKSAQRKRMKIEAQMAGLRLEQKAIAKDYYDLLAGGWEPPNNSNIVRLLVASSDEHPTG